MALARNTSLPMMMRIYFSLFSNATPHGVVNASQCEIAELVGTSQQVVSKHMKALRKAGLLNREKRHIQREDSKLVWRLDMEYGWQIRLSERNEKLIKKRTAVVRNIENIRAKTKTA